MLTFPFALVAALIAGPGPYDYETVEIADHVYGFFQKKLNPIVSSNVIAVIGTDAVLVFDTGNHPTITRRIIADLKRITDKPVRYLVVSHWHDDHWVGNAEFADAYPGVQVIAHPFTARLMEERKDKFRGDACKADLVKESEPLRQQLAGGKKRDGAPLPEDAKARMTQFLEAIDEQLSQCDERRYRGVDRRVDHALTLDLGGRTVELRQLGRGNTAGDLVAYVPDTKTLLTGDLLVFPFPFATQSYIGEWAKVLRRLDKMDAKAIVPGHGPVLRDKQYLEDVTAVLESIDQQARAAYRPGMTADDLRAKVDISKFSDKFSHGDPFIKANFDYMMGQPAINRVWQELAGKWEPEGG